VRERFDTSSGVVEVVFDEETRIVSAHRFGGDGRPVAAAIESWDHVNFGLVLRRQLGLSLEDTKAIVSELQAAATTARLRVRAFEAGSAGYEADYEPAGIALRFVAVLLDAVVVLLPLAIVVGLLSGGGYSESGGGSTNAGVTVGGSAFWLLLLLGLGYYIVCESATGMTLGKRLVGICVIDEAGRPPTLGASVVRNLLRLVDGFLFYLVGAIVALASPRGQRLGDRAAHTLVVRR
jgi:uncharacterized RDD family membrane protein YckC